MNWPRGRYNGKRVGGIRITSEFTVLWWYWRPRISLSNGAKHFHWLFIHLWFEMSYQG